MRSSTTAAPFYVHANYAQDSGFPHPRQDLFSVVCLFCFVLGPHSWHMEVPRLGVKSEQQLPVYTTATATPQSEPHL